MSAKKRMLVMESCRKKAAVPPWSVAVAEAAMHVFWPSAILSAVSSIRSKLGVKIVQTIGKLSAVLLVSWS